jgi:hypothetical protein
LVALMNADPSVKEFIESLHAMEDGKASKKESETDTE